MTITSTANKAPATARAPAKSVKRPPNGAEYLESLRDDREIYIYGKRVKDVTTHPAFRNSARSVARLYDSLHDPEVAPLITLPTDTGSGGFTHAFFKAPKTKDDLIAGQRAIEHWQRLNYGWMGRTPDYKASFTSLFRANQPYFAPFEASAEKWYKNAQEQVLFLNHAIVNPPIDRDLAPEDIMDVFVHVNKETDAGIYVTGAKVVATGSAITQGNFVAHSRGVLKARELAVAFIAPMHAPGVKLICRHSYEYAAATSGSPFDYPLSSRMDENDAILIFDNVFVPWEDVFFFGETERAANFMQGSQSSGRVCIQAFTRLKVKLEFITGALIKAAAMVGRTDAVNAVTLTGELVMWRNVIDALLKQMIEESYDYGTGYLNYSERGAITLRAIGPTVYTRMRDIVQRVCTSGLIYLNSNAADFKNEDMLPYLERFMRGSGKASAQSRSKVMKLLWDCVSSEFGARNELYERNYLGDMDSVHQGPLFEARASGNTKVFEDFVDKCMSEYDLDGWKLPGFFNGEDVRHFDKL